MGITTDDLRRALAAGGDITSLSDIFQKALGCPPIPAYSLLNQSLPLPLPQLFLENVNAEIAQRFNGEGTIHDHVFDKAALSNVEVMLVPVPPFGKHVARYVGWMIDEIHPDAIALDISPAELGAHLLGAFSLPAALGLPFQMTLQSKPYFPGNTPETAILKSWLNKIPLLPSGQPPKTKRLEYIAEQGWFDLDAADNAQWEANLAEAYRAFEQRFESVSSLQEAKQVAQEISLGLIKTSGGKMRESVVGQAMYMASRILDIASAVQEKGRQIRLVALVDMGHYPDVQYVLGLLQKGILEETYMPSKTTNMAEMQCTFQISEQLNHEASQYLPETTLSQDLLREALATYSSVRDTESISESQSHRLIIEIAGRTRNHAAVLRGASVRGAIAFEEIAQGLSAMSGVLNRSCIARAALITLPPRIVLKQPDHKDAVIADIVKEVLFDIRFSNDGQATAASLSLKKISAGDILSNLNALAQTPSEMPPAGTPDRQPAVVAENQENRQTLQNLESMGLLKKDQQGQYQLTKKALDLLLEELEQKLQSGQITRDEYNRQKSGLMKAMQNISRPNYQMSSRELATTVLEMMDAQDKLWEKEINFSTLHVYYHVKENNGGSALIPQKRDYQALKRLMDDLDKRKILTPSEQSSGFVLSGMALNLLLKYLVDKDAVGKNLQEIAGIGKARSNERKSDVRRYSHGDAFRDISVRHTLNEIARQKKPLSEVRNCDFRVLLKQQRKPQSDFIICLDTSGSMGFHQKMTYARLAAAGLVQAVLDDGGRVGLVAFNDYGEATFPLTSTDKDALLNRIASATPRGNTNIGDGLKSSLKLLIQSRSNNPKYILLITDGQPTAISESDFAQLKEVKKRDLTEESALLETRRAAARGIKVSVIHIAAEADNSGTFIKDIARVGKGKIRRVSSSDDLKAVMR